MRARLVLCLAVGLISLVTPGLVSCAVPRSAVSVPGYDELRPAREERAPEDTEDSPGSSRIDRGGPAEVLRSWDRRRGHAYATGDLRELRSLYVRGSSAGRRDARLLRAYVARGLHVSGMRMQVLAIHVLASRPNLWRLRVTDRVTDAVAVADGWRVRLPDDRASTRLLTLWRVSPRAMWQVRHVASVDSPRHPRDADGALSRRQ